jgi:small subunit ribosomal protein S16
VVAIRLRRGGAKKKPFYRVVAVDSRRKTTGSVLDILGYYDPKPEEAQVKIDLEKYNAWIEKGARPSEAVKNLVKKVS